MSTPQIEIVIRSAGVESARHTLGAGEYTIGRGSASRIPIKIGPVSRQHARLLVAENGNVQVEDLGSANGTFLDDHRVSTPTTWDPSQTLFIGDATLHLVTGAANEFAPTIAAIFP